MKITGMTRRIDELGRIVLPKEIRSNLRIKSGDMLEIFLNNDDEILLKKYSLMKSDNEVIKKLVNIISKKANINIIITNLDEIIYSSNRKIIGEKLDNIKLKDGFKLSKNCVLNDKYELYNINPNGDVIGNMYIEYNSNRNIELVDLLNQFLNNYYEI